MNAKENQVYMMYLPHEIKGRSELYQVQDNRIAEFRIVLFYGCDTCLHNMGAYPNYGCYRCAQ